MQVSTTHIVPQYVRAAFDVLQREHLFESGQQNKQFLGRTTNAGYISLEPHLNEDGSWKRLQALPEQRQRQQVAIMNQPMPPEQSKQRQAIEAQVQADLERILGKDNLLPETFHDELEKTMKAEDTTEAPLEMVDGISEPRIVTEVKDMPFEHPTLGEGVWEPRKPMAVIHTYHVTPDDFRMDDEHRVYLAEIAERRKVLPLSLVQWLGMLNDMSPEQAAVESGYGEGARLLETVKSYLFHINGVQTAVADELEYLGYQVSYDRINGTLLLEMRSGAIRWSAV